jgi:hypothetical protein
MMSRDEIASALWLDALREVAEESGCELPDEDDLPSLPKAAVQMADRSIQLAREQRRAVGAAVHLTACHAALTELAAESLGAVYSERLGRWVSLNEIERAAERKAEMRLDALKDG